MEAGQGNVKVPEGETEEPLLARMRKQEHFIEQGVTPDELYHVEPVAGRISRERGTQ